LEEHLRDCPACVARLQSLSAQDTLTDAMRAQTLSLAKPAAGSGDPRRTLAESGDPRQTLRMQTLIQQAKLLYSAAAATSKEEPLTFLAPPLENGDLGRLGSYRVRKVLGIGGMGIVFEAVDTRLQRPVALKVLRPHLVGRGSPDPALPGARERFVREARAAASLHHDNLVPIYEVGEEAGLPFLAMQLLAGESLESRWQREGRLPVADIVAIGRQIASGLAAAHERGLVHRDIKPANIWLESVVRSPWSVAKDENALAVGATDYGPRTTDFCVKILDFGLARAVAEDMRLTQPGTVLGTPLFMAPEQADGQAVDARADLFSLGSVLYALCTGAPAFEAPTTMAILRAVCDKEPRPIQELNPDIPAWLTAVIAKLQGKNPEHRFQSAAEVVEALQQQDRRKGRSVGGSRRVRRAWAAAAALLLACIGLGIAEASGLTQLRNLLSPINNTPSVNLAEQLQNDAPPEPAPAVAQEAQKPIVVAAALFPFEERGAGVKDMGARITDLLFAKLAARPELLLVDRADLNKTLAEQELNLSGAVQPDQATRVGQLTGAKLLISGSIFQVDKKMHLVARLIGTETSRVVGASVEGKVSDELGPLVDQLANQLAQLIAKQTDSLIAKAVAAKDRMAAVRQQLKNAARPSLWVEVSGP
jgi:serine/threonine protein kinase/TolB-like protein